MSVKCRSKLRYRGAGIARQRTNHNDLMLCNTTALGMPLMTCMLEMTIHSLRCLACVLSRARQLKDLPAADLAFTSVAV